MPPKTPKHGRRAVLLLSAALWPVLAAGAAGATRGDDETLAELERIAQEAGIDLDLPSWDVSGGVGIGLGHRSNVRLAAFASESSGFVRAAADAMAWRLPRDGVEWVAFFDGTCDRYFSATPRGASLAMASLEWRWRPRDSLQLTTSGRYVFQDEFVDASTLESGLGSIQARVHGFALKPGVRWNVSEGWTLTGSIGAETYDYREPLSDFSSFAPEIGVTRSLGPAGDVSLAVSVLTRDYREQEQAAEGGRPLSGTRLQVNQQRGELRHEIDGGASAEWSVESKVSFLQNRDNGSGWYDYDRSAAQVGFEWKAGPWTCSAETGWMRYTYLVQTAGFSIDPPPRRREVWSALLRVERTLGGNVSGFVEWSYEDNRSNDPFLAYEDNVVLAGVRWSR
jgi:hypothetical protein